LDNTRAKEVSFYIVSVILCLGFLVWVMQLWFATLTIPFAYSGDAIFEGESIKSLIDIGGFFQNPYIGMPTGFFSYDYPSNCFLDLFIMKLISFVFPNWAMTMNIFFLLTFPLTTIATLFVFRKLNISPIPAITGSLLFTFVPFHFLRGEWHLVLSSYFLLPLMVLVIFWIFEDDFLLSDFEKGSQNLTSSLMNAKSIICILICIGIALEFVYYPFFSCFFLLIAGLCTTISRKKWSPLLNAGLLIGIILLCIFMTSLPTILYHQDNGKNLEVAIRSPIESEIYGLKITQLLLPVSGHRIPILAHISDLYSQSAPLVNENSFATLGIIGSVGFCILILWIFYQLFTKDSIIRNETLKRVQQLSVLNLSAVLLATVGGFGTVFACLILPQIRCYNRISIFIAFFCITVIVLLLDLILQKYSASKTKKWLIIGFIIVVLLVGIYDQTTEHFVPDYKNTKTIFLSDQQFIQNIEETFPNDTLVFQLPYVPFPENPPVNQMGDYDHFRAYLNSENIHWSYGAMKGRDGDLWQREIASKPMNDMVENLSFAGFTGIYVDSYGYADKGSETISSLSSILQTTPIVSENKRLYFFDLTKYNEQLKSQWTPEEFAKQKDMVQNPLRFVWQDGFSGLESSQDITWRWCSSRGTLNVTNPTEEVKTILINTTFSSGYPEYSQLKIESPGVSDILTINNAGYRYQKEFIIPPGQYTISFISDAKRVDAPNDPRYLMFRLDHPQISERS
jgi:hypothetical protein